MTTNSAGLLGATPTSTINLPLSMSVCDISSRMIQPACPTANTTGCNQRAEGSPTSRSRATSVQGSDLSPSAMALPRIGHTGQK
jgi:hypothetical protein